MIKGAVIGATGYAGQQLVWFLHNHEYVKIEFVVSHSYADEAFSKIYNNYTGFIQNKCINIQQAEYKLEEIDVLFIALPHGKSFDIVKKALAKGVKVIDLGADFRLNEAACYEKWYGVEHKFPELLNDAVYGLVEIYRDEIKKTRLIANPGCYTTASILALYPLLNKGLIEMDSIIIDAKSGVSGAGRGLKVTSLYGECNESIKAYGIAGHRHTPEIEQELSKAAGEKILLNFTPHLVPMNRGILATCYGKLKNNISQEEIYKIYKEFYKEDYFIRIVETLPETRNVRGSNLCDIGIRVDERTKRVIVISAIDNLIKGAAGQAVQNMNLMFGLEESEGINVLSMAI
ncbi:N-acetyl-gamma-glutamyl-phosphate reductase [Clostridium ganghwense]|uniref:N-acetyl-gamma-glutamyl-phosphate reductase n=1 Tax=Clostridium ganghwense TaxID=312089 RepID=A0ABT4CLY3_9CLOT|nr:N-acetyl-gamma-glutamyl-phosphate reductase [Clostridium ganghwense]MCY6370054.1 N-acetyl-gamma-glutamyl-phosphate reductase [Clostridium ganghwense]